jgi:oligopeptide transport system substrate-binding protein
VNLAKFKWLIAALICLPLLGGCGRGEYDDRERKSLVFCSSVDVTNFDPQVVSGLSEPRILNALFEGLVVPDPNTYKPLPGVADRWSISEDGKIYEFHLRNNARWSNGDLITADDFVFSARRALSSRLSIPFIEMFLPIRNAERFYTQQTKNFNEVGIRAISKHTLRIELEKPMNSFIYLLMQPCWYPLNSTICDSIDRYNDWNDFFPNIITNGPFTVTEKMDGKSVMLGRNPHYWDFEAVQLDEITFLVSADIGKNLDMFRNGVVDICAYNPQGIYYASDLVDEHEVKSEIHFGCFYLILNTKNKPLDDRNVRVALGTAFKRRALLEVLSLNDDCAAYGLIPTLGPDYKAVKMFRESFARARELLAMAGYENGENFPKLRIICDGGKRQYAVCAFLRDELKKVLNIDSYVECPEGDEILSMRKNGKFDICCGDWCGDYPDPEKFLKLFSGESHQNHCRWRSNEYDELLRAAAHMRDDTERLKLLKDAERLLVGDMPIIPLYFESDLYLLKKRVKGWDSNLLDIRQWKFVDVEGR